MSNYAKYKDLGSVEDSSKNITRQSGPPQGMPPAMSQGMPQGGMPPAMSQGMPPAMSQGMPQGGMPQGGMPPAMSQGMPKGGLPQGGMPQGGMHTQLQQNNSAVIEIQSLDHKKHFINNNQVCVVKVHADWCQPCKAIAPRYQQMAQKYNRPGVCALVAENADLNLSNVKGVPTHQFFKNGQYINADIVGADISAVEKRIIELLSSS